jgi:NAD(P)-dependent dehydrogenase (short-subunit alcohol dehydrogenase family)
MYPAQCTIFVRSYSDMHRGLQREDIVSASAQDLSGRVAIVTGAGRGLGKAEALQLAQLGATVIVNDVAPRDGGPSDADAVVREITDAGGSAVSHHADVGDFEAAEGLIDFAIKQLGRLDILVNNAGILRDRMIFNMNADEWDAVVRVHLTGHFNTTRWATNHWRALSKARGEPVDAAIVNTASEAYLNGSPGQPNYAAAKGGIVALTLSTSRGCGSFGVRANAVCPRAQTDMTAPLFGSAVPEDDAMFHPNQVAPLIAWLGSPAATGVSGHVFVAYGPMIVQLAPPTVARRWDAADGRWNFDDVSAALDGAFSEDTPNYSAEDVVALARPTWGKLGQMRPR